MLATLLIRVGMQKGVRTAQKPLVYTCVATHCSETSVKTKMLTDVGIRSTNKDRNKVQHAGKSSPGCTLFLSLLAHQSQKFTENIFTLVSLVFSFYTYWNLGCPRVCTVYVTIGAFNIHIYLCLHVFL